MPCSLGRRNVKGERYSMQLAHPGWGGGGSGTRPIFFVFMQVLGKLAKI